uniref:BPTI/Kunitz inhibitor domain-containing protein n=1 Tax=Monopterus albus TaxID=43700 RepID=A0A3Q3IMR4_MONAL
VAICVRTLLDPCTLPQDIGSCQNYALMWFFDKKESKCSRFWYGGCGGNENRFETRRECENLCQLKRLVPEVPGPVCGFPNEAALVAGRLWFFDKHIAACSPFWYGGCGGNANRFNTESECFWTCGSHSKSWSRRCLCDPGSCWDYTVMWFFDTEQNECFRFWYGGCGGNENRFRTQEECENLCLTKIRFLQV